ncbi:glycerol-3-phosphate 1-O-acyltransferase PlsY [Cardiobacteriales bacterium ML27]|uniref:Glycerol-3-phosphate acyltransferase n=1 Tax=Ostreibacterium oceani TaxID=2654998 RepID=A0A6N7EY40_9GAMM|nr:glycerol-3-phosphate 1-O-acyltransferase PlsY [Ostreibacterium oceani]
MGVIDLAVFLFFILTGLFAGYLFGSISCAIVVCRLLKLPDPRQQGSKNPGATNVMRLGGKKAGLLTFAGDCLKGVIVILLARLLTDNQWVIVAAALGAFIGHLYPLYFGFKGGKGVATYVGIITLLQPLSLVVFGLTWLLLTFTLGYVSVASLVGALAVLLSAWWLGYTNAVLTLFVIMTGIMFIRHRQNIINLMNGTENKIRRKQR